eukprot:gb/GEZN01003511.1/.p1 GENE.gb/GEZN01003511.1/~~gb/GEZN01003511.1/.p1  ORF type:complete len:504 (+),score=104.85 gb/GEZN01003511.1/:184-1695(+)
MSSMVETMRALHQDLEVHAESLGEELVKEPKTIREQIARHQKVAARIEAMRTVSSKLGASYKDEDGVLSMELQEISGEDSLAEFYKRLKVLEKYHRQFPGAPVVIDRSSTDIKVGVEWTHEEARGRFLDLHEVHELFVNCPQFERCDYLTFLNTFEEIIANVPREQKLRSDRSKQYRDFLEAFYQYLKGFFVRTNPLVNVSKLESLIETDFAKRWDAKAVPGWFEEVGGEDSLASVTGKRKRPGASAKPPAIPISSSQDSLFCVPCNKRFSKQTVYDVHLTGRKHKKASKEKSLDGSANMPLNTNKVKEQLLSRVLALTEEKLVQYTNLSRNKLNESKVHAELKQTRTKEEIEADLEEDAGEAESEDEGEEKEEQRDTIYNPLNLPLGWDGKPIPLWLYKLHGLNIPYSCEICGNHTYFGPRAYQRHFKEWRHVYGMRCLGIPNTKHFMHLTKMKDAQALHDKLKVNLSSSGFKPEEEEEFEDKDGNVFNKKTYEDLRRQGLI